MLMSKVTCKSLIAIMSVISIVTMVLFVSTSSALAASKEPIKIGVVDGFTGATPYTADIAKCGLELALDQANRKVGERKLEVYYEDTELNPSVALIKAQRLVMQQGVHILMGVAMTSTAYALQKYVEQVKIPLIVSTSAGADDITKSSASPHVFRVISCTGTMGTVAGDWAYKQGYRKAVLIGFDYGGGIEQVAAFARQFTKLGGKILQEMYPPLGTKDFSSYIAKIDRSTDIVFGMMFSALFMKQYAEFGLQGKIPIMMHWATEGELVTNCGDAGVGNYTAIHYANTIDTPVNKKFVEDFYAKYGKENKRADVYGASGYVGGKTVLEALRMINGNVEDKDAFLKALKSVRFEAPNGPVKFDEYNMFIQNYYVTRVEKKPWKQFQYQNQVIQVYENISQFWPYSPQEYMALPKLGTMKGKLVTQ